MAPNRRLRGCPRVPVLAGRPARVRGAHALGRSAWQRLLDDGRVYVAEPAEHGLRVIVLAAGEGGVRRLRVDDAEGLAAFLLEDATGRRPPQRRIDAFAADVLGTMPPDRFVVTSLDLCCWTVVHAVLDER